MSLLVTELRVQLSWNILKPLVINQWPPVVIKCGVESRMSGVKSWHFTPDNYSDEGQSFAYRVDKSTLCYFPSVINNTSLHRVLNRRDTSNQCDIRKLVLESVETCLSQVCGRSGRHSDQSPMRSKVSQPATSSPSKLLTRPAVSPGQQGTAGGRTKPFGTQGILTALPPTIAWGAALWHNSSKFWLCNTSILAC